MILREDGAVLRPRGRRRFGEDIGGECPGPARALSEHELVDHQNIPPLHGLRGNRGHGGHRRLNAFERLSVCALVGAVVDLAAPGPALPPLGWSEEAYPTMLAMITGPDDRRHCTRFYTKGAPACAHSVRSARC
jgi:hypothetical protein